tara:strand:- start:84 stop:863 length:780 start_codon:yes stop_codon:yes gene_type:complete
MKKVLIIGYGDIGKRLALMCPQQEFIGVSRSISQQQDNVEFIQLDWIKDSIHNFSKEQISTVVLIFKPTSSDVSGYQTGFLEASHKIIDFLNHNIIFEKLIIVSSTRVYGLSNGRNITELVMPIPDDEQGKIILDFENFVFRESKVEPLILRPSGLYSENKHWMKSYIEAFNGKKYSLPFSEANMFSRDNLALVMANYISNYESTKISGPLICSEKALSYSEIFSRICPEYSFEDFFISSDVIGKSFDSQKLLDSGLMR